MVATKIEIELTEEEQAFLSQYDDVSIGLSLAGMQAATDFRTTHGLGQRVLASRGREMFGGRPQDAPDAIAIWTRR